MKEKRKKCIDKNQCFFVENMDNVREVCDHLLFTDDLRQEAIENILSNNTRSGQVRELTNRMRRRPDQSFYNYYKALKYSGNTDLAQRLEPYLSKAQRRQRANDAGVVSEGMTTDQAMGATGGAPNSGVSPSLQEKQHNMTSLGPSLIDAPNKLGYNVRMDVDNQIGNYGDSSVLLMEESEEYIALERSSRATGKSSIAQPASTTDVLSNPETCDPHVKSSSNWRRSFKNMWRRDVSWNAEMTDKQKDCLRTNHDYFVTNMVDVKKVCDCLFSSSTLTRNMVEQILMAEKTNSDKVRALLTHISKRPARDFDKLYETLNMSGNERLASQLEPYLASNLSTGHGAMAR